MVLKVDGVTRVFDEVIFSNTGFIKPRRWLTENSLGHKCRLRPYFVRSFGSRGSTHGYNGWRCSLCGFRSMSVDLHTVVLVAENDVLEGIQRILADSLEQEDYDRNIKKILEV